MTNPVSACLIVRDDEHVAKTVACLRPHVAEICIAHTPCDELPERLIRELCDRYISLPPGPDGRMEDASVARNASFALATQPYVMWADSDDLIEGLEFLPEALAVLEARPRARMFCPYHYLYDKDTGVPSWSQWRERIVRNDGRYTWDRPWHEVLIAKDGQYDHPEPRDERIVWKHQREEQPGKAERAVRILRRYEQQGHEEDPWLLLYLGMELGRAGEHDEAANYLVRAGRTSGDGDGAAFAWTQAAMAQMATSGFGKNADWTDAEDNALSAAATRPEWFEPPWILAQIAWLRATLQGDEASVQRTVDLCAEARSRPVPQHPLPIKLVDRTYGVHELERAAYETLGDWRGALSAAERALAHRPQDGALRMAKRRYEAALKLEEVGRRLVEAFQPPAPEPILLAGIQPPPEPAVMAHVVTTAHPLDIVFACGLSWQDWNPAVLAEQGLGGSETAVVEMSRRLAARGHHVRVLCQSGGHGIYDGVEYRDVREMAAPMECHVLVAWRMAPYLASAHAKTRVLWCHDTIAGAMNVALALHAQRVLALSAWHKRNLMKEHTLAAGHVYVTRNGVDLSRFDKNPCPKCGTSSGAEYDGCGKCGHGARHPHRAIYASSHDRGLQVLLDLWPEIRRRIPNAELEVFYSNAAWKMVADGSGSQQQRYSVYSLERRMGEMKALGVTYLGGVNQGVLAEHMLTAGVWLYPTWFDDTSCIGAMEAQAAGLRIVASSRAALPETIGQRGHLIAGDWLAKSYQQRFVDAAVEAMRAPDPWRGWSRSALQKEAAARFSWDGVVTEWEALFETLLAEADDGVLPPYAPAEAA